MRSQRVIRIAGDDVAGFEREHDGRGFWVLVGLTHEETEEFEQLDRQPPLTAGGQIAWTFEGPPRTVAEQRWRNLFEKHKAELARQLLKQHM